MKTTIMTMGVLLSTALAATPALAQSSNPGSAVPAAPIMMETETPHVLPQRTDENIAGAVAPSPADPQVPIARTGEWIYTATAGYLWVPSNATTYVVGGVPAAFLYTEEGGWTWYASPWGEGKFKLGAWVARPSPEGLRAWALGPGGGAWHETSTGHSTGHRVYGAEGHYFAAADAVSKDGRSASTAGASTVGGSHQTGSRSGGSRSEGRGAHH